MDTDATKTVEEFTAEAQKTMENSVEKMTKSMEDVASFGRHNMDAVVACSKRAAKVAEDMNAEIAAFAKKSYEDGLAAAKDMTAAKSVTELLEKQVTYSKATMESFLSEATKLSGMMTEASKEVLEPLQERFTAAAEMARTQKA